MALGLAALAAGCDEDVVAPPEDADIYSAAVQGGDDQVALPSTTLDRPLQVIVVDTRTGLPAPEIAVSWAVVAGSGATLSDAQSATDSAGIAQATLTLGPGPGSYAVEVAVNDDGIEPARYHARALDGTPVIATVTPGAAAAGDTVLIDGAGFGDRVDLLAVLVGGFRAEVVSATTDRIRAVVPGCLPDRPVELVVSVGSVPSEPAAFTVEPSDPAPLMLERGEVRTIASAAELACLSIEAGTSGDRFLIVVENAATVAGAELAFRLTGAASAPLTARAAMVPSDAGGARADQPDTSPAAPAEHAQLAWELEVRQHTSRALASAPRLAPRFQESEEPVEPPGLGDRREFWVVDGDREFKRVTAVVQHVSDHAIIYEDQAAPADGLRAEDFERFGALFDDPIFDTDVAAFGQPSDLDGNGRVIVLLTPVVNTLTPRGSLGFVGGFFFPCDLFVCENSNHGEIFYGLVPDPAGEYGDVRTREQILLALPPLLAHEFQHMVHFNQRNLIRGAFTQETLWLAEGLAHMAEDLVAEVFERRGDVDMATRFRGSNRSRAFLFLGTPEESPGPPHRVSLLSGAGLGTLEQRGAAWLFVKYLAEHHGQEILGRLTATTLSGTTNVQDRTSTSWAETLDAWSVALWADDAPELEGAGLDAAYGYPDTDLRDALFSESRGGYPLHPPVQGFGDFAIEDTVAAASAYYLILDARDAAGRLGFGLAPTGTRFDTHAEPRISILRID
ncbi:MAG: IPT/TIG domain-containing protein [Longimicrobiales bacterium]